MRLNFKNKADNIQMESHWREQMNTHFKQLQRQLMHFRLLEQCSEMETALQTGVIVTSLFH